MSVKPSTLPAAHRSFEPRPFRPLPWLPGRHLQTLGGKFLRPRPDLGLERVRIDTPDGDFLDLDVAPEPVPGAPPVVILHGLEGSTSRGYVRVAMRELLAAGLRPVGMNFRSCSGVPNRQPRFYHSGDTPDLVTVLDHVRARFPGRPVGALGFSLGGNVLLRYLGGDPEGAGDRLDGAVTISVPFDLTAGTEAIEQGIMGRLYSHYFMRSLRGKARLKADLLSPILDMPAILRARTLREFDAVATAPLHGYESAEAYYLSASSAPFLKEIRVPTLLIQAEDDPFLPSRHLPRDAIARNPSLVSAFTSEGGHVGFIEHAAGGRAGFWAEGEAARYLRGVLSGP